MTKTGPKGNYKMTPEVIRKLETVFAIGGSVKDACIFAGISSDSYYRWIKENPELSDRFDQLRAQPILAAKHTIVKNLSNVHTAQWYLERKRPEEFGKNVASTEDSTYWDNAEQKKEQRDRELYDQMKEVIGPDYVPGVSASESMVKRSKEELARWEEILRKSKEKYPPSLMAKHAGTSSSRNDGARPLPTNTLFIDVFDVINPLEENVKFRFSPTDQELLVEIFNRKR